MKNKQVLTILLTGLLLTGCGRNTDYTFYPLPAAAESTDDNTCYATCRQFESALLVGCYLSDFEGRHQTNKHKAKKRFEEHEKYCRALVKEIMGKDSGCKQYSGGVET